MKAKHSQDSNDYKLTSSDYYRIFEFNWDNINSFDDFKKANLLKLSLDEIRLNFVDNREELFGEWIKENPDFDKYFMMCY